MITMDDSDKLLESLIDAKENGVGANYDMYLAAMEFIGVSGYTSRDKLLVLLAIQVVALTEKVERLESVAKQLVVEVYREELRGGADETIT